MSKSRAAIDTAGGWGRSPSMHNTATMPTTPDAATDDMRAVAAYLANAAAIVQRTVVDVLGDAAAREAIGGRRAALLERRAVVLELQLERWRVLERSIREADELNAGGTT